jgi:hypothetical protein
MFPIDAIPAELAAKRSAAQRDMVAAVSKNGVDRAIEVVQSIYAMTVAAQPEGRRYCKGWGHQLALFHLFAGTRKRDNRGRDGKPESDVRDGARPRWRPGECHRDITQTPISGMPSRSGLGAQVHASGVTAEGVCPRPRLDLDRED